MAHPKQFAFVIVALACLAHTSALRAEGSLDPSKAISQYLHEQWLVADGLPSASVHAITQTRDGYLWLGTQDGLVRFDGARFTIFDKSNTPAFLSDHISALEEGRDGSLWVGASGGGLIRLKGGHFTPYSHRDGLGNLQVSALLEQTDGTLWVGTAGAGVYHFKDGKFIRGDGLSNDYVLALAQRRDGSVWIGTRGGGINRWKDEKITPVSTPESLADDTVWSLFEDREENLWIGTLGEGLKRLKDDVLTQFSTADGLSEARIASLWQDQAGSLWVGTFGGLDRLRDGKLTHFSPKGSSQGIIMSLFQDREGSLWFGAGGGLQRLRDGKFTLYSTPEGLSSPSAMVVLEDQEHSLWVGTAQGLNRIRQNEVTVFSQDERLARSKINSLAETSDKALWIGTDGAGLWKLKQGQLTAVTSRDGLPGEIIMSLMGATDGSLWIGTYNAGLARLKDDRLTVYSTRDGLTSDVIRCIAEGRDGSLWVGTDPGGLNRFKDGHWTHEQKEGLGDEPINALHEDAEGVLWIAAGARGLYRLKDGRLNAFTARDGLFNDGILLILEDGAGRLWMGCNKGIFSVRKQDLDDFAEGRSARIHCNSYDAGDGMRQREVNGGTTPTGWRGHDGRLWFPTTEGIVGIDPSHIPVNPVPPDVMIEEASADGRATHHPQSLVFPAGSEKFEIRYTASSLLVADRVRFRYRLDGFDKTWNDVGTRRVAYYTHLPPGEFTFRVIACNSDGVWNETGAVLALRLEPFFYQTSWFYVLCAAAGLLFAYGAYNVRLWQLKARERELLRLVKERTQELEAEKSRSERLLLNVLPAPIAFRLKQEEHIADHFTEISVLFCDIVDFTALSATMSAKDVVVFLNRVFSAFDRLAEKHDLEKIKTIGDAYMVASGLPTPRSDHAEAMAEMALDMLDVLGEINAEHQLPLKVRIGIHSGPVVAGVIGLKKFSYDLWGDTVNTASRMESHGIVGQIQVSEAMYRKLKDKYVFQARGSVEIKGKGQMATYLLIGRQNQSPPVSEDNRVAAAS